MEQDLSRYMGTSFRYVTNANLATFTLINYEQDENFHEKHTGPGLLSMVSSQTDLLSDIPHKMLLFRRIQGRTQTAARYVATHWCLVGP